MARNPVSRLSAVALLAAAPCLVLAQAQDQSTTTPAAPAKAAVGKASAGKTGKRLDFASTTPTPATAARSTPTQATPTPTAAPKDSSNCHHATASDA